MKPGGGKGFCRRIQYQLHPLIVSQFQQERRIALLQALTGSQEGDKFLGNFQKIRGLTGMLIKEGTNQPLPTLRIQNGIQHRKPLDDKTVYVVEKKLR